MTAVERLVGPIVPIPSGRICTNRIWFVRGLGSVGRVAMHLWFGYTPLQQMLDELGPVQEYEGQHLVQRVADERDRGRWIRDSG